MDWTFEPMKSKRGDFMVHANGQIVGDPENAGKFLRTYMVTGSNEPWANNHKFMFQCCVQAAGVGNPKELFEGSHQMDVQVKVVVDAVYGEQNEVTRVYVD